MRDLSKAVSALLMILGASPLMAASISSTSLPSARSIGKAYYHDGEFKKAAAQFRRAIEMNPNDAESHYWMGMSYEKLADIAVPFDGKYRSKARMYLRRAMESPPDRAIYRRELFDSLLDVDGASSASFRQAAKSARRPGVRSRPSLYGGTIVGGGKGELRDGSPAHQGFLAVP